MQVEPSYDDVVADVSAFLRQAVNRAVQAGIPVRGYLSTAFWCAFEGKIAPEAAVTVAESLISIGVDEVSISDTIGKATPTEVARLLDKLLLKIPADRIAVHFGHTNVCDYQIKFTCAVE